MLRNLEPYVYYHIAKEKARGKLKFFQRIYSSHVIAQKAAAHCKTAGSYGIQEREGGVAMFDDNIHYNAFP